MTETAADNGELLTIDGLAARCGLSVRTIRFYAGKGLLPPPRLRGRVGLYGPDHVARLDLVSELSGLGFTLAAIEGYLTRLPTSCDLDAMVLHRALLTPWVPERIEEVTREELDRRAGRVLTDAELDMLEALGAVERGATPDGVVVVYGAGSLSAAFETLDLGLSPRTLRRSHEIIAKHTGALAEELMGLFQAEVLQPYRDRGRPSAERTRLRETFSRLKPITVQGVVTAFGRAVNRTIRERFAAEES